MPVIVVFLVLVLRSAFPVFRSMQAKLDKVNLIIRENITGVRVVRAFTAVSYPHLAVPAAGGKPPLGDLAGQNKCGTLKQTCLLYTSRCV